MPDALKVSAWNEELLKDVRLCRQLLLSQHPDPAAGQRLAFRREMTLKPLNHGTRWVRVRTVSGTVTAFTFVSNRLSPSYVGKLPPERVADVLAIACGHSGSGAAYLYETVTRLRAVGIEDRGLWQLQSLVAERIRRSRATSLADIK